MKFAKYIATPEDNATVLPQAVRFVTSTYEMEIADQAGDDGDGHDGEAGDGRHARPDRASQERDEDYMPK